MDSHLPQLGDLENANCFHHPIDIADREPSLLLSQLRTMALIRRTEERLGELVQQREVHCPCHLGIGQEAVAVGVAAATDSKDRVFGTHRSHSHYLAMGGALNGLFAEVFGKATGATGGMGGSMHLLDRDQGFHGSVPIVGATIPVAVGAGLAAKMDGGERLSAAVCFFGDGTTEEGGFHESLNLAAVSKLPVLFVCENNLFSSHLHISLRQPHTSTARFAQAHCIPHEVVDGNDVGAVQDATERLMKRIRKGEGPGYLEAVTYRWRGHVGPREDDDVGVKRKGDLKLWKKRDPIGRLKTALIEKGESTEDEFQSLQGEVNQEVESAIEFAQDSPFPPLARLYETVYARRADH